MIGQYPPVSYQEVQAQRQDHFFSFGDGKRTLHPDKKSWALVVGLHAAGGLTYYLDHRLTHAARETNDSEIPVLIFMAGMDTIAFKAVSPSLSIEAPIYEIIHYGKDATR